MVLRPVVYAQDAPATLKLTHCGGKAMTTYIHPTSEKAPAEICTRPAVGAKLADYIVGLLKEGQAEKVENHLVECAHCMTRFLTIRRIRAAARARKTGALNEAESAAANGATIAKSLDGKRAVRRKGSKSCRFGD